MAYQADDILNIPTYWFYLAFMIRDLLDLPLLPLSCFSSSEWKECHLMKFIQKLFLG